MGRFYFNKLPFVGAGVLDRPERKRKNPYTFFIGQEKFQRYNIVW